LNRGARVFVAGHRGMVGSALVRHLRELGYENIVTASRAEVDLSRQEQVERFFQASAIDQVYLAAARVGGILANNSFPAQFIYENLMIECNVIHTAHLHSVQRLMLLGSSCIYPVGAQHPLVESALLTGTLEPTNEPYALAKIAGIKLCESYNREYGRDYRSVMPTNLYGPNDNFEREGSHVIPALLRRFHDAVATGAREITVWGSGTPLREFLHVEDMARATVHVMELPPEAYQGVTETMLSHINVGTGEECSISELAQAIALVTGFDGRIVFDRSKPDGAPRKLMDSSKLARLGWRPSIPLVEGLRETYRWYLAHQGTVRW
jgi:GDP-L-fucose synthase